MHTIKNKTLSVFVGISTMGHPVSRASDDLKFDDFCFLRSERRAFLFFMDKTRAMVYLRQREKELVLWKQKKELCDLLLFHI